jgi:Trk K+ transport system NAD-binding subunit
LIARAETPEAEANILSFGANEVINPFEIFASRLALAMKSPSLYCLYDWMTGATGEGMKEPPSLAVGKWIICDFGRFGRALYNHLENLDVTIQIIENDRQLRGLPAGSVIGRATEAPSLKQADIEEAVGIIAGTRNDANNLSIILTATELNPDLFRVVRQNRDKNSHLFSSADYEMLMQRGSIISNTIFAFIRTPMLGDFLRIVSRFKNEKASELVSRIIGVVEDDEPILWEFRVNSSESPALCKRIQTEQVQVGDILKYSCKRFLDNENGSPETNAPIKDKRLSAMPLFMKREDNNILLPEDDRIIRSGDRFLMCGTNDAYQYMHAMIGNFHMLDTVLTGKEAPAGSVLRWFAKRKDLKHE